MMPEDAAAALTEHLAHGGWMTARRLAMLVRPEYEEAIRLGGTETEVEVHRALEAATRRGLAHRRVANPSYSTYEGSGYGRKTAMFTTPAVWDAEEHERNLTPAERAERGHAAILAAYDRRKAEGSDDYWHWHTYPTGNYADMRYATEAGLIISVGGDGKYIVPVERIDAYRQAEADHKARQECLEARMQEVQGRLRAASGVAAEPDSWDVRVTVGQAEALLAILESRTGEGNTDG